MHHRLTAIFLALSIAPAVLADTTIIHAGQLLAIPGEASKPEQTIVIEGDRIVDIRNGFADPAEFAGGVTVIDLKAQFVLPGLTDVHVHLQHELGPKNDSENLKMSAQQIEMRSVLFAMRTLSAGFTTVRDTGSSTMEMDEIRGTTSRFHESGHQGQSHRNRYSYAGQF